MSDNQRRMFSLLLQVLAAILLLAVPFIWHRNGLDTCGSTDYLAYLGALLGSFATIVAVVMQIRAEGKARKEEHEQSVRPVIWCGIDGEYPKHTISFYDELDSEFIGWQRESIREARMQDELQGRYFTILKKGEGRFLRSLVVAPDEDQALQFHFDTYQIEAEGGGGFTAVSNYLAIPLVMKNVGVGPALNLREGTKFIGEETAACGREPRVLGVNDEVHLVLCIDASCDWDFNDRFDVTATYETITGQTMRFAIEVTVDICCEEARRNFTLSLVPRTEAIP